MEKKFRFSDKPAVSKIVYLAVIAILCVSAIVIGIVAANNRKVKDGADTPPETDGTGNNGGGSSENENGGSTNEEHTPKELAFISPVKGTVITSHSTTVPVFSETLEAWKIHTGLDISCEENAEVKAAEAGTVSRVYNDPMLGKTVEISHSATHKTRYSNLAEDSVKLVVGDSVEAGAVIGNVGYTGISEIADESHLHFEMLVSDVKVNPLDYITEESLEASLGIVTP